MGASQLKFKKNVKKKWNEADVYLYQNLDDGTKKGKDCLFTRHEIARAMKRADKQLEDIPKKFNFWNWLKGKY